MYNVSDEYKAAMRSPEQVHTLRGSIGTVEFDENHIVRGSFVVSNQCSDSAEVKIGQVYVGELKGTFINVQIPRYSWKGLRITPYAGIVVGGTTEEVPLGIYTIEQAEWKVSGVAVTAYDNMAKFDKVFNKLQITGEAYMLANEACSKCGVTLGCTKEEMAALPNGAVDLAVYPENDIETWRDFISWLAQTLGCFATIDRAGQLIFRQYGGEPADTIEMNGRTADAAFSDFETRYTGMSVVDKETKTTNYYCVTTDDGLTYNLGSNPFLQYGTDEMKKTRRLAVLSALQAIRYVPFSADAAGSPAYDLGDVLVFSGGIADGKRQSVLTQFEYIYGVKYRMKGVGKNPALATGKSKTDKDISGLMSNRQADDGTNYTVYTNIEPAAIGNGEKKQVIDMRFAVQKRSHVTVEMEFLPKVEASENEDADTFSVGDIVCEVTYYLNGEEMTDRYPAETWQDGRHVLTLRYDIQAAEERIHTWGVWMKMTGGRASFTKYGIHCVIAGTGLAGSGTWDGNIRVADEIERLSFNTMFADLIDTVETSTHVPAAERAADTVEFSFSQMFGGFADEAAGSSDGMFFSPWVNNDMVMTDCTVDEAKGWIGAGTTVLGTEKHVTTEEMTGVTGVSVMCAGAVLQASFDGGETWKAYDGQAWMEGKAMTEEQLAAVPASAWQERVKLRALLEDNASLFSITAYGGIV